MVAFVGQAVVGQTIAGQTAAYSFMVSHNDISNLQALSQAPSQVFSTALSQDIKQQTSVSAHLNSTVKAIANAKASEIADNCCDVECCEGECICPANTCASALYVNMAFLQSIFTMLSESTLGLTQKQPHFIASSLYRPPIFIS
ncbi:MAG: hypothetical protein ACPG46_00320 [Thalassotalea sp.]